MNPTALLGFLFSLASEWLATRKLAGGFDSCPPDSMMERERFTTNDAAQFMSDRGFRVSVNTIYDLIHRGELPAARIGGRWCISRDNLERLMAAPSDSDGDPPPPSARAGEFALG